MPFREESSFASKEYSPPRKPFLFHVCTMDADGSGNKRLTEKSIKEKHIDRSEIYGPTLYAFQIFIGKGRFLKTG